VDSPSPPPQQVFFPPSQKRIRFLRTRARATLLDAWRLHILSALTLHTPPAGYLEWVLQSLAVKAHAELQELQNRSPKENLLWKAKHGRSRSEGRNALDLGERSDMERRLRSPLSIPFTSEDGEDRVVYPRRDQGKYPLAAYPDPWTQQSALANEWGVRIRSQSPDELDAYTFELPCGNQSLIGESFSIWDGHYDPYGDLWDDDDRFTFDMASPGSHCVSGMNGFMTIVDGPHVHFQDDWGSDFGDEDPHRLVDTTFHFNAPVAPSDVNEDDDSDESQPSPRTPEDGEEIPLSVPSSVQPEIQVQKEPLLVSRTSSSRPRPRSFPSSDPPPDHLLNGQIQVQCPSVSPASHPPLTSSVTPVTARSPKVRFRSKGSTQEYITERLDYLQRIYSGLNLVRLRAQEEGWRLIRASVFGAPTGWTEDDGDRALEMKAKRRAWSSGVKVAAPYISASCLNISPPTLGHDPGPKDSTGGRVWDGRIPPTPTPIAGQNNLDTNSPPIWPPGLCLPRLMPRGPIVPTGLSLGKPLRSSPLSLYALTVHDLELRQGKYGVLNLKRVPESLVFEKRIGPGMSFVSFPESPTRTMPESPTWLFPVCEEDGEDDWESESVCSSSMTRLDHSQTLTPTVDATSTEGNVESEAKGTITSEVLDGTGEDVTLSSPVRLRTRTTSMYSPSTPSASPALPMFRPLTPPPSYQTAVGGEFGGIGADPAGDIAITQTEEGKFDSSSILLRPLSKLSISSAPSTPISAGMHEQQPHRPPLTSNPSYVPQSSRSRSRSGQQNPRRRPRSISLPAAFSLSLLAPPSLSSTNKRPTDSPSPSSRLSERGIQECEDLSQAYLTPPPSPSGPIIVSSIPAPHEQHYPRYAHVAQVAHAHVMSMPRLASAGVGMRVTKPKAQERRVVSGPGSVGSSGAVLTGAGVGVDGKGQGSGIPGGLDLTTVFEGSGESAEDVGGCEVALELGRAEEGRIVW